MEKIFTVYGEPQGKGRPRFSTARGYVRTYTPEKTASYEALVVSQYAEQCKDFRFGDDDYIDMRIYAYFGIPKSVSKKKRAKMIAGEIRPTKKPDFDNIGKIIADSLNGIAYKDDAQVVDAIVRKFYSDTPRVVVKIRKIETEEEN